MSDSALGRRRGALWLIAATIVSGGSGYVVTITSGSSLGPQEYEPFAFFWSSLYMIVAAVSGIQQELTRAASPSDESRLEEPARAGAPRARMFVLVSAATALFAGLTVAVTAPLWAAAVLGEGAPGFIAPLAAGVVGYTLTAVLSGVLSGIGAWSAVAAMTMSDGLLRLLLTALALTTGSPELAAWGVAAPFLIVPAVSAVFLVRNLPARVQIRDNLGRILRNAGLTVLAAAAIGVLVSGLPALLSALTPSARPGDLASAAFAINLLRAPLVIAVLALQGLAVVHFRETDRLGRDLTKVTAWVVLAGTAVSGIGWWAGPALVELLAGDGFTLPSIEAVIIISSGAMAGVLTLTGAATLAVGRHRAYACGWAVGALATIGLLAAVEDSTVRLVLALLVAPLAGAVVHIAALCLSSSAQSGRPFRARG